MRTETQDDAYVLLFVMNFHGFCAQHVRSYEKNIPLEIYPVWAKRSSLNSISGGVQRRQVSQACVITHYLCNNSNSNLHICHDHLQSRSG